MEKDFLWNQNGDKNRTISVSCTFWKKDYATATVFHFLVYLHRKSQKMKSYNWNTEKKQASKGNTQHFI
jgi:hypothetical protein